MQTSTPVYLPASVSQHLALPTHSLLISVFPRSSE
jgi:hypothetical protein